MDRAQDPIEAETKSFRSLNSYDMERKTVIMETDAKRVIDAIKDLGCAEEQNLVNEHIF